MYLNIVCDPPLSQSTVIRTGQASVPFTVVLETDPSSQKTWEVGVWHNLNREHDWELLPLLGSHFDTEVTTLSKDKSSVRRQLFTGKLCGIPPKSHPVSFTVKFRVASAGRDDQWQWVQDRFSLADGHLYYAARKPSSDLDEFISGMSSELDVGRERPDTVDTRLWRVTSRVPAAVGNKSSFTQVKLGKAIAFTRWFSLVRVWTPWIGPRQGKGQFKLDNDAFLLSFLRHDGLHVVALALSGIDDSSTWFRSDDEGNVLIVTRNDAADPGRSRALVAVADSFEVANAAVMYHARKLVMDQVNSCDEEHRQLMTQNEDEIKPKWLEDWYDGFAYCTWNGLGQDLNETKIYDALDALEKNDIHITNLIIDDNWQSLDRPDQGSSERRWMEFEANKQGFPNGLKHTVDTIRKKHPNVTHVAVWHALLGYWSAVSPNGKIAKEYKIRKVQKSPGVTGNEWHVVDEQDVHRLYDDFYKFLSSCGVDSVKTDAQFAIDEMTNAPDRRDLIRPYQDAWAIAILRHFSARAISCMSQAPVIMFHSQMPTNRPRILVRNSDDFFPNVDSSHPWHIFCNAHNTLFTQHLNVLPDWDMFQTSHPWARFHGAARCVSGGPIYFTDEPNKHDVGLIRQMTAKTIRGTTCILRPSTVGKTTTPYVTYDEEVLLKIETYVGNQETGTGILGIFNVSRRSLTELVPLATFPGTEVGRNARTRQYIVRAHTTNKVSKPMSLGESDKARLLVDIETGGWEIFSAHPLRPFMLRRRRGSTSKGPTRIAVAPLGLLGKMTGAAAIIATQIFVQDTGRLRVWASLKALGTYGLYISDLKDRNLEEDFIAMMFGRAINPAAVKRSETDENVLEIDVERAWKESGRSPGWSNELAVEVFIR
ncbi:raffinose synthase protein-like protein Sip1 [Eremomyces bilateralis CBS 781.70]|uniref:Raffinose synthase protein-like protein Sip1 n=1 Tax=Eremomyces bilateralis CBS 781.70 TaxID=1392243 RepID=A0A6G1GFZ7_9PEZI|nr:raffinose synthase protein-like protein Sip1 [Eremomyces bilateralis CBS 781.70]KAF1817017.1 raffinose synthase protein-like protein Sip1 [Eremomyces bilateralis CBS 781.70]